MVHTGKQVARHAGLLVLLFLAPGVAAVTLDGTLALVLLATSFIATACEICRQRTCCLQRLPFPIFLMLVYALQILSCLLEFHSRLNHPNVPLPDASMSIVMAAHNEHKFLQRTLDSIVQSTPKEVLVEIILVDDGSEPPLSPLVEGYTLVKVLRHELRRGLIKSKTEGGNLAVGDAWMENRCRNLTDLLCKLWGSGVKYLCFIGQFMISTQAIQQAEEVLMFLDAHVRPAPDWYRPLLKHIKLNYKRVVVPLIPILDDKTWQIDNNAVGVKMMFDWTLFFNWFEDGSDVVPCMSGGLFAISKKWWHESGEYDYGMNMWGAENIEQSIRRRP
eukprot:g28870.t1